MSYPLENALFQWEDGRRRLSDLESRPAELRRADQVISTIREELRRRIGPTFTAGELADLYGDGTEWAQQIASALPLPPGADLKDLVDAAFWQYLQGASDFSGGRRAAAHR